MTFLHWSLTKWCSFLQIFWWCKKSLVRNRCDICRSLYSFWVVSILRIQVKSSNWTYFMKMDMCCPKIRTWWLKMYSFCVFQVRLKNSYISYCVGTNLSRLGKKWNILWVFRLIPMPPRLRRLGLLFRMGFHAFKLHRYASAQRNFYFSRAQEVNLVDCFGGIYHCQLNWPFQVQEVRSSSLIIFPAGESHAPAISLTNPPPNKKFQFNPYIFTIFEPASCQSWKMKMILKFVPIR